jgi:hypothetical protein
VSSYSPGEAQKSINEIAKSNLIIGDTVLRTTVNVDRSGKVLVKNKINGIKLLRQDVDRKLNPVAIGEIATRLKKRKLRELKNQDPSVDHKLTPDEIKAIEERARKMYFKTPSLSFLSSLTNKGTQFNASGESLHNNGFGIRVPLSKSTMNISIDSIEKLTEDELSLMASNLETNFQDIQPTSMEISFPKQGQSNAPSTDNQPTNPTEGNTVVKDGKQKLSYDLVKDIKDAKGKKARISEQQWNSLSAEEQQDWIECNT